MSRRFTDALNARQGINEAADAAGNSINLDRPLDAFGDKLLDVFQGPLDEALRRHFRSYYRLEWIDCYRSLPNPLRKGSWTWHKDNVPYSCIKVMLHLTHTTAVAGAMQFLDWSDTRAMHAVGYFGVRARERVSDLASVAARHGLNVVMRHVEARPGDVLIFDNNLLHSAIPPEAAYRDVCTMFIIPSEIPWDEALRRSGRDVIQDFADGYPPRP